MIRFLSRYRLVLLAVGAFVALSSGATAQHVTDRHGWLLPDSISEQGDRIDGFFWLIFWITGVIFVLTEGALIWFIIKYRRREGNKALYIHGNHKVEVIWTIIPAVILCFIGAVQLGFWQQAKDGAYFPDAAEDGRPALQVQVMAQQFAWNFRYAGPDSEFGTDDDFALPYLLVAQDVPTVLTMRSIDVIHSLFIPHCRFKQDIVPGLTTQGWIQPRETGIWPIACAELCGAQHYTMSTDMHVIPVEEWDARYKALSDDQNNEIDYKSEQQNFRFWDVRKQ